MGFAASQARFVMLTARKSDLELAGQFLQQARTNLANITGQLFNVMSDLETNSAFTQQLQARIAVLQALDKALEMQLRRIDTQQDAVQTEIDAVRKVVGKNIAGTFKTFG